MVRRLVWATSLSLCQLVYYVDNDHTELWILAIFGFPRDRQVCLCASMLTMIVKNNEFTQLSVFLAIDEIVDGMLCDTGNASVALNCALFINISNPISFYHRLTTNAINKIQVCFPWIQKYRRFLLFWTEFQKNGYPIWTKKLKNL